MSASPGRSTYGVALEAISGVTLIGVGAGLTVAWSVETTPLQWVLLCLALLSILAGVYFAVSASRGSRTLPPAGPPTLTQEVLAALNPAWLAALTLLSKKSDDSIWLHSLGVGFLLLSLGMLATTLVKRVRAKAEPT
jgi:disulfide bond formation protein DsbB